jgi:hypothetical protein
MACEGITKYWMPYTMSNDGGDRRLLESHQGHSLNLVRPQSHRGATEDDYQEQIVIPEAVRQMAEEEGIGTENDQKVAVQICNLNTGELHTGRLAIPRNEQIYVPTEIQKMLESSGKIRLQILGG